MKSLFLILATILTMLCPAKGQQLPASIAASGPEFEAEQPPMMQAPPAPGHYSYLYRDAFWNATTRQWRADSLRVQGRQTWVRTLSGLRMQFEHLAGYNFQTGDTSYSRYTYWGEGPFGYTDTLNRIFRVIGSNPALREYRREHYVPIPGGYKYAVLDYVNGLDSTSLTYYYLDGLGRLSHSVRYGYGGLPVRRDSIPMVDSNFYRGASPYPYMERIYTSLRVQDTGRLRVQALWTDTDSIAYDAQGRRLYEATDSYSYVNRLSGHSNVRRTYQGSNWESITKIYGLTSATPPQPRPLVARWDINIYDGDSVKHYYHNWNGSAFRLDYRRTAYYPSPGREFLDFSEVITTTDSLKNGLWKPYLGTENRFAYGTGGEAKRLVIKSTRYGAITSMEKKDVEFYTPGLLPVRPHAGAAKLAFAPNPANSTLCLISTQAADRLVLTNSVGQKFALPVREERADISALANGIYHAEAFRNGAPVGACRLVKD